MPASRAGANAEPTATTMPATRARITEPAERVMVPGRLETYSALTVVESMPTAPAASTRPKGNAASEPTMPISAASNRNATMTAARLAPRARMMPISLRRRTTETETVL